MKRYPEFLPCNCSASQVLEESESLMRARADRGQRVASASASPPATCLVPGASIEMNLESGPSPNFTHGVMAVQGAWREGLQITLDVTFPITPGRWSRRPSGRCSPRPPTPWSTRSASAPKATLG
ncbi:SRPBCC family protein [Pseudomonas aeruginosa]